ncbi:matrixin family metalloprotease [Acinetobacter venetianus]|uniref:Matrixin n=1 Tax=Acinetobacter venetianus TaxID=52133 RepID=A0A150HR41_9GAMM|nr:Matrixin [Acinetobacter venetianus]
MYPFFLIIFLCLCVSTSPKIFAQSSETDFSAIRYSKEHPLRYRIADLDPRLNITKQQVIELTKQATEIWAKDTGQQYFVYDPKASFVIHLVFDQRQMRSMKRAENLKQIEKDQNNWDLQNQKMQMLKEKLLAYDTQIQLQNIQYQTLLENYRKNVERSKSLFQRKSLAFELKKQAAELELRRKQLNQLIAKQQLKQKQFNSQKKYVEILTEQLTTSVVEFNQVFKPQILHKGQFDENQIFIFEFSSLEDLRLTLAHEFGHALGLKHTHDPRSLMYPRIKDQDAKHFELTDTDLSLLGLSK